MDHVGINLRVFGTRKKGWKWEAKKPPTTGSRSDSTVDSQQGQCCPTTKRDGTCGKDGTNCRTVDAEGSGPSASSSSPPGTTTAVDSRHPAVRLRLFALTMSSSLPSNFSKAAFVDAAVTAVSTLVIFVANDSNLVLSPMAD